MYASLLSYKHPNDLTTSNLHQRALESYLTVGRYRGTGPGAPHERVGSRPAGQAGLDHESVLDQVVQEIAEVLADTCQIFEPSTRLHGDEVYEGTGIGLAIVRKAARLMGSEIGVASAEGVGSTFINISRQELESLPIPRSHRAQADALTRRVGAVENAKAAHVQSLCALESLFASLQHRAFRGEL